MHVPFKAAPEILGEMIAGRIDYFLAPIAVALPFIRESKLVALAVNTAARLPSIPGMDRCYRSDRRRWQLEPERAFDQREDTKL